MPSKLGNGGYKFNKYSGSAGSMFSVLYMYGRSVKSRGGRHLFSKLFSNVRRSR